MNNFNQMVGNTNMYSKNQSSSYFNPAYGATTPTNNIIWVQGIEGAKAWQLNPNSMAILLDSEVEGKMYIKVSDNIGMSSLRIFNYEEESCNYKKFGEYYLTHYNKIVAEDRYSNPNVIPKDWGKYTRADVDPATRKINIQAGFEKWVRWETEVKQEYERLYKELINLNEVAAAIELQKYITEVDEELASATQKWLELKAMDWNICDIIDEQDHYYKKYSKKIKSLTY